MNHVSVSPTDGNGPTQGQRKTLTRVGIEPPPLHRLSHKVRREQAVGSEDVKVTAINIYKYKERLRLYKRWPCSTYIFLNRRLYKRNLSLYLYMFIAVTLTSSVPTACSRLTLWLSRWSGGDLTRRSWVQFPPWSEFFSVLVWAHFHL